MRSIMIAIGLFLAGAQAFADEPKQTIIRTFRGGAQGFVLVRQDGVTFEYVPGWRPNVAQQAAQYDALTNYYRSNATDLPKVSAPSTPGFGPGFNTIPDSWITDRSWIKDGPVWVGPLDW